MRCADGCSRRGRGLDREFSADLLDAGVRGVSGGTEMAARVRLSNQDALLDRGKTDVARETAHLMSWHWGGGPEPAWSSSKSAFPARTTSANAPRWISWQGRRNAASLHSPARVESKFIDDHVPAPIGEAELPLIEIGTAMVTATPSRRAHDRPQFVGRGSGAPRGDGRTRARTTKVAPWRKVSVD